MHTYIHRFVRTNIYTYICSLTHTHTAKFNFLIGAIVWRLFTSFRQGTAWNSTAALITSCSSGVVEAEDRGDLAKLRDVRNRGDTLHWRLEDIVHSVLHLVKHWHLASSFLASITVLFLPFNYVFFFWSLFFWLPSSFFPFFFGGQKKFTKDLRRFFVYY